MGETIERRRFVIAMGFLPWLPRKLMAESGMVSLPRQQPHSCYHYGSWASPCQGCLEKMGQLRLKGI